MKCHVCYPCLKGCVDLLHMRLQIRIILIFTVRQKNVVTGVCLSISLMHPPPAAPPGCTPFGCTPWIHPLPDATPLDAPSENRRSTGGWCSSYWNAYLLSLKSTISTKSFRKTQLSGLLSIRTANGRLQQNHLTVENIDRYDNKRICHDPNSSCQQIVCCQAIGKHLQWKASLISLRNKHLEGKKTN